MILYFAKEYSSPKSDSTSEKSDFEEYCFSETCEEIHTDDIGDDSTLNTGCLYRTILQEQGIDKVRYQYGENINKRQVRRFE
jgi:hypothetical protein